jgi:hypothetical protein
MVGELGQKELLSPGLVNEALAANDRAKYLLTLLQAAREHADHPHAAFSRLQQERMACAIAEGDLDTVVERSRKERAGAYHIAGAAHIHRQLLENVRQMLIPLKVREAAGLPPGGQPAAHYEQRLQALLSQVPLTPGDQITWACIDQLTSGQRNGAGSLHLLVMDLHKELNRLQQQIATETIHGAEVYGIGDADRPLVTALGPAAVGRTARYSPSCWGWRMTRPTSWKKRFSS